MRFTILSTPLAAAGLVASLAEAAKCPYKPVKLRGYGTFSGTVIDKTLTNVSLPEPVDAWLGIPYASPPVGEARFQPVTWPEPFEGIKPATSPGKNCLQPTSGRALETQSEDCLTINVYRPNGVSFDKKLPVLVWIHGGSFNLYGQGSFDGAAFVSGTAQPLMVVSMNYRLGILGFPSAPIFEEEGLLNLGIRDQRQVLRFVQKYVSAFGGNPDEVTIGGLSAGAHSVGIHLAHDYDNTEQLFARAWLQSGSPTGRAFPTADYGLYRRQFTEFMGIAGCNEDGSNREILDCLRSVSSEQIRNASATIFDRYNPMITWPWQPNHGGDLFERPGSTSGIKGTFFKVPVITSTTTDEGKEYVPGDLETNQQYLDFMRGIAPGMTKKDIEKLARLYPDPATNPDSPYINAPNSTQYNRVAATWSDYAYICPSQETAYRVSESGLPVWKLRWDTNNKSPAWKGIPHSADMKYTWGEPTAQYPDIGTLYHAYLASFVATGNPNTRRLAGTPKWPNWKKGNSKQLVIKSTGPEVENDTIRSEQCLFWRDPERQLRLDK